MARKLLKTELCVAVAWAVACAASVAGTTAGASDKASVAGKETESSFLTNVRPAARQLNATREVAARQSAPEANKSKSSPPPDLTGRKRAGKASFYGKEYFGRKMADGQPMDPQGDNAASRTLPLGTTAKVTNVETGKTAIVTIQDRGPYVEGRLVDLSPATAAKIGLTQRQGLANVVVAPIAVPLPNGDVKAGAAAHEPEGKPDMSANSEKSIRPAETKEMTLRNEKLAVPRAGKASDRWPDSVEISTARHMKHGGEWELASVGPSSAQHK